MCLRQWIRWGSLGLVLVLTACGSTQTNVSSVGPSAVGPSSGKPLGSIRDKEFEYASDIFLDVAIPVFDPGFPLDQYGNIDDEEIVKEDIWPQVRRLEANRFAIETKKALQKTRSFGTINVTPDPTAIADLYVLGKINYSDTETVKIGVKVIDAANKQWGEKVFEHRVGEGFYRDALRKNQDPYGPVFQRIARYVFDLLKRKSEATKQNIQQIADVRYAASYSPDEFTPYLSQNKKGVFRLEGLPSENDTQLQRIENIKVKDEQFIDTLQDSYESFYVQTHEAYRSYQEESLSIAIDIRRKKGKRLRQGILAAAGAAGAVILAKNSGSTAGEIGAVIAGGVGVVGLANAIQNNRRISSQKELFDELGQNLDIKVTPQVVEFNEQSIELTGTASEQHAQLKQRLYEIHQLEETPDTPL
jgi:hypothetical protein